MLIGRVIGNVVSTQKHRKYEGAKLLLVQPTTADGQPRGTPLLAVDSVGAGVNERVLVVLEGRAAGEALRRKGAPVDSAIIGIIDEIDVGADPGRPAGGASAAPTHSDVAQTTRPSPGEPQKKTRPERR